MTQNACRLEHLMITRQPNAGGKIQPGGENKSAIGAELNPVDARAMRQMRKYFSSGFDFEHAGFVVPTWDRNHPGVRAESCMNHPDVDAIGKDSHWTLLV